MNITIKSDETQHKFLDRPIKPKTSTPVIGPQGAGSETRRKAASVWETTCRMVQQVGANHTEAITRVATQTEKDQIQEMWQQWCEAAQEELKAATGADMTVPMELPIRKRKLVEAFPGKETKRLTPSTGIRWLIDRTKEVEVLCQSRLSHQPDICKQKLVRAGAAAITNTHQAAESRKRWDKAGTLKEAPMSSRMPKPA
jgi:hypothetical protein